MALSRIQKLLADATKRSSELGAVEYVPVWFFSGSGQIRIGSPICEYDVNPTDPNKFIRNDDVVYHETDVMNREGRTSIKESIEDLANGRDVRVFADSPPTRANGAHLVFEYDAYFQFDKFLNNISNFIKLRKKDRRIKFKPKCKTITHKIRENG